MHLLGTKVLSLLNKISVGADLTLKIHLISRLFLVVEKLGLEMDPFSEKAYKLLIFFLVEWHDCKILRNHLMANFTDLFTHDKVLSLHILVEPICSVISLKLQKDLIDSQKFLSMADFSFFWALACKQRITQESAIEISKVM